MDGPDKRERETKSLLHSGDFFRKVVVTGGSAAPWSDENGIVSVGVIPFLLDPSAIIREVGFADWKMGQLTRKPEKRLGHYEPKDPY